MDPTLSFLICFLACIAAALSEQAFRGVAIGFLSSILFLLLNS